MRVTSMKERDRRDLLRRRDGFHLGMIEISWIDNSPCERNVSVSQWNVALFMSEEQTMAFFVSQATQATALPNIDILFSSIRAHVCGVS